MTWCRFWNSIRNIMKAWTIFSSKEFNSYGIFNLIKSRAYDPTVFCGWHVRSQTGFVCRNPGLAWCLWDPAPRVRPGSHHVHFMLTCCAIWCPLTLLWLPPGVYYTNLYNKENGKKSSYTHIFIILGKTFDHFRTGLRLMPGSEVFSHCFDHWSVKMEKNNMFHLVKHDAPTGFVQCRT